MDEEALWRMPRVEEVTGLRKTAIYALEARGQFPSRVKLTAQASAWPASKVRAWIADRIAQSQKAVA